MKKKRKITSKPIKVSGSKTQIKGIKSTPNKFMV